MEPGLHYISKRFMPKIWALTKERVARATPEELQQATAIYGNKKRHFNPYVLLVAISGVGFALRNGNLSKIEIIALAVIAVLVLGIRTILINGQYEYIVMSQYAWYFCEVDKNFQAAAGPLMEHYNKMWRRIGVIAGIVIVIACFLYVMIFSKDGPQVQESEAPATSSVQIKNLEWRKIKEDPKWVEAGADNSSVTYQLVNTTCAAYFNQYYGRLEQDPQDPISVEEVADDQAQDLATLFSVKNPENYESSEPENNHSFALYIVNEAITEQELAERLDQPTLSEEFYNKVFTFSDPSAMAQVATYVNGDYILVNIFACQKADFEANIDTFSDFTKTHVVIEYL